MNKGIRNYLVRKNRKRRILNVLCHFNTVIDDDGNTVHNPKWTDVKNTWWHCYTHQGKPCSCPMCSPYKYDRKKHKTEIQKRINDGIQTWKDSYND